MCRCIVVLKIRDNSATIVVSAQYGALGAALILTDHALDGSNSYIFEAADNQVQRTPYGHIRHALLYKTFFWYWVRRSLVTRYRQTSLGWLWALLQPLLSSLIYVIIFTVIIPVPTGNVPYPLFIITDLVFWSYFSRVVLIGAGSITNNIDLLTRIQFPREFLPLAVWVESLVDLLLGLCIVAAAFLLYQYPLTAFAPLVLVAFVVETMLALGLAFLLASMSVIVRDLMQVVPLLMQLLVYLSPVIYPLTSVPKGLQSVLAFNPLSAVFATYQETLFYGQFTVGGSLLLGAVISAVILVGGYLTFKRVEWQFADLR